MVDVAASVVMDVAAAAAVGQVSEFEAGWEVKGTAEVQEVAES